MEGVQPVLSKGKMVVMRPVESALGDKTHGLPNPAPMDRSQGKTLNLASSRIEPPYSPNRPIVRCAKYDLVFLYLSEKFHGKRGMHFAVGNA